MIDRDGGRSDFDPCVIRIQRDLFREACRRSVDRERTLYRAIRRRRRVRTLCIIQSCRDRRPVVQRVRSARPYDSRFDVFITGRADNRSRRQPRHPFLLHIADRDPMNGTRRNVTRCSGCDIGCVDLESRR